MTSARQAKKSTSKKKTDSETTSSSRLIKKSSYKSFKLHKRIRPVAYNLPSSWKLLSNSFMLMRNHWKLIIGIGLVYGVLMIVLVRGFGSTAGLTELKDILEGSLSDSTAGKTATGASLFLYLLGTSGNSTDSGAGVYQFFVLLVTSLAIIWALRQIYMGAKKSVQSIRVRDAFYRGMYPLVPFILILLVLVIEIVPATLGTFFYSTVMQNGIAVEPIEKALWVVILGSSLILSAYLVISTIFALFIVALPDMPPIRALRSARGLVMYRRWSIIRKVLFLLVSLLVIAALVMIPLILFATAAAEWVFFVLSIFGLLVIHTYMYALYRELLHE